MSNHQSRHFSLRRKTPIGHLPSWRIQPTQPQLHTFPSSISVRHARTRSNVSILYASAVVLRIVAGSPHSPGSTLRRSKLALLAANLEPLWCLQYTISRIAARYPGLVRTVVVPVRACRSCDPPAAEQHEHFPFFSATPLQRL